MSVSYHAGQSALRRFGPVRIFEHGFHILLFGLLVCTGHSQKYYESDLSFWLIVHLGGGGPGRGACRARLFCRVRPLSGKPTSSSWGMIRTAGTAWPTTG